MITQRRYDIDWLRVFTISLLLVYHTAIVFQPWGAMLRFVQNDEPLNGLWKAMSMINVWRIPLLFYVSGMGVCFAARKRTWKQLMGERMRRILVPFVLGIFAIVPIHLFIWQKYYNQDIAYWPNAGHLWFLGNIFAYVLILSPLFFYLIKHKDSGLYRFLSKVFSNFLGMLFIIAIFILEVILVKPDIFEIYALTLHGFVLGFLAFFFGFCIVLFGESFGKVLHIYRWVTLSVSMLLYLSRIFIFDLMAPSILVSIESTCWILAVFAFASQFLNKKSSTLSYLSTAAYPVYILHMIFLYVGSILIVPMAMPGSFKFILVVLITFIGCFVVYEFIIRRLKWVGVLFGLKKR